MSLFRQIGFLLHITRSSGIARRYFVVNGFDGALTMLGLITGFYVADDVALEVVISACLGAGIALGISGVASAYVSEAAERKKALDELERAMVADLEETAHGKAARLVPFLIAVVNGFSPFTFSLLIISPLWLAQRGPWYFLYPLEAAICLAFAVIFFLGIFLGKISGTFWLWSGIKTSLIALGTMILILMLG